MTPAPRPVVLYLPADMHLLRVARVTVASAAMMVPFTLQDVEDLRVAVDELSAHLIGGCSPDAVLEVEVLADDAGVTVSGRVRGAGPLPPLHPVAAELLAMVAPEYGVDHTDGDRTFRFIKRAQVPAS